VTHECAQEPFPSKVAQNALEKTRARCPAHARFDMKMGIRAQADGKGLSWATVQSEGTYLRCQSMESLLP